MGNKAGKDKINQATTNRTKSKTCEDSKYNATSFNSLIQRRFINDNIIKLDILNMQNTAINEKTTKLIRIVAISDTHMKHNKVNMPKGDILILSYCGSTRANRWLGIVQKRM